MTKWPERPQVGDRPVIWYSDGVVNMARPEQPEVGDAWEKQAQRLIWNGSDWVPEFDDLT